ncbi:MAG TPA: hypothetical protein VHM00_12910 [Caldimonas sp.]|jgi:Tfp pilus assembly protein PilV|nr:hypothetical protein [Caldimonas sp.]HEX2541969.1 hypothetical protein [Caldimonas sp.]
MNFPRPPLVRRHAQRGATLFESLLAFVVLAAGTVTVATLQATLRQQADVARERSEAVRLGEEHIEQLRSFATVAAASGVHAYAAIADDDSVVTGSRHASYRIVRSIDDAAFGGAKAVSVAVHWTDRAGTAREVAFSTFIARNDPVYAGALALGAGAVPGVVRGRSGRAAAIPVEAKDLGDGRSVLKPVAGGSLAFVLDNHGGAVVGHCSGVAAGVATRDLALADLSGCTEVRTLLVAGTVRFTSASPPSPAEARELPLELAVTLSLSGGSYPAAPQCTTEARKTVRYVVSHSLRIDAVPVDALPASLGLTSWHDTGDRFLAWHCLVTPRADGRWSGRAELVASGWTIGAGSGERRVCRYASDIDGSGAIDANIEHPRDYSDVAQALPMQNFLVVNGTETCPGAPAVRITGEGTTVHADLGTTAHQP